MPAPSAPAPWFRRLFPAVLCRTARSKLGDAVTQKRRDLHNSCAQVCNALALSFLEVPFADHKHALPIISTVDQHENLAAVEWALLSLPGYATIQPLDGRQSS
jgi:hypothetical protein